MSDIAFRILGPLEVTVDANVVQLGGRKPRMLLATLLLQANVPVSADTLIDVLWPDRPPRSALANLRTYAHLLRTRLAEVGQPRRIESRAGGYVLTADTHELDVAEFEDRAARARMLLSNGDARQALPLLREANRLWRGRVLEDLPQCHAWQPTLARLDELRLSVLEQGLRLRVDCGESAEVVPELRGLLADHPLREELWRLLMLALAGSGRAAEALRAYAEAERVLAAELGTAPGRELRLARERVLEQATQAAQATQATDAGEMVDPPAPADDPFPVCQLPMDLPDFTGREPTVQALLRVCRRGTDGGPGVAVLTGPPGIGKSALAVHVAHHARELFPDGQLYVDLGAAGGRPRDPGEVLGELLGALGVRHEDLPPTVAERAARYRSTLARRRVLIVLDDAASADQVRPLLPGAGSSVVLVTSRARLADLPATFSTVVDVLSVDEAGRLLARVVGWSRVGAEPDSAARIVRLCAYSPLAIRVASARLAARPRWSLRLLAERMSDERRRLDELRVGGLSVRTNIASGYQSLPPAAAQAVRLVGLLGPMTFPGWVLGALLDRPNADDVLDALVEAHLLETSGADAAGQARYRLPELLRCFAEDRLSDDPLWVRQSAVKRVLRGYLRMATQACRAMPVHFFGVTGAEEDRAGLPDDAGPFARAFAGEAARNVAVDDPVAWFDAERRNVTAAARLAADLGMDDVGWRLPAVSAPFLDLRGYHDEWRQGHEIALECARRAGDDRGRAIVLRNLGQLHVYQDNDTDAQAAFAESLRLFTAADDERGSGVALAGLGTVQRVRGEHRAARQRYGQALMRFVRGRDRHGEAVARTSIGTVLIAQRHYHQAEKWVSEARALAADIGDRHREAHTLQRLATIRQHQGRLTRAEAHLNRATALFEELGDHHCGRYARQATGELCLRTGDLERAELLLTASLSAHRRSGDHRSETEVLGLLGELHRLRGQVRSVRSYFPPALELPWQVSAERRTAFGAPAGS